MNWFALLSPILYIFVIVSTLIYLLRILERITRSLETMAQAQQRLSETLTRLDFSRSQVSTPPSSEVQG